MIRLLCGSNMASGRLVVGVRLKDLTLLGVEMLKAGWDNWTRLTDF